MKTIYTDKAPKAIGPYSQGYESNNMIYTSGQLGLDPASGSLCDGIEAQTEQACKNIAQVLNAGESDLTKVVKTTCFLSDINNFSAFNTVYEKYFTGKPARSCVEVAALPKGALVEIEAIAEK